METPLDSWATAASGGSEGTGAQRGHRDVVGEGGGESEKLPPGRAR